MRDIETNETLVSIKELAALTGLSENVIIKELRLTEDYLITDRKKLPLSSLRKLALNYLDSVLSPNGQ